MRNPLPSTVEARLELALKEVTAPQKQRLLRYIIDHPGEYTHTIAAACAVGYISARLWELNREVLPRFGLYARCYAPEKWLQNRWGETSHVHQWRLELLPSIAEEVAA